MSAEWGAATAEFFETHLAASGLMGIFRGLNPAQTVSACVAAWDYGAGLVEVPVQSAESLDSLRAAVAAGVRRGAIVGGGTVLKVEQVALVAAGGGRFCVSPGFDPEISLACEHEGLHHLPGVATATEITFALEFGHSWVKAFPAALLGAAWVTAMRAPFPELNVVCTGGMSLDTRDEYLAAGARAVAIGGGWTL